MAEGAPAEGAHRHLPHSARARHRRGLPSSSRRRRTGSDARRLEPARLRPRRPGLGRRPALGGRRREISSASPCRCATASSCAPTCTGPRPTGAFRRSSIARPTTASARRRTRWRRRRLAAGYAVVLVDVRGRYDSRRSVRALPERGPRRLRHDRMGGGAALVDRRDRDATASPIRAPCSGSRPSSRRRT